MPGMAESITPQDLSEWVTHWLGCPPGGYLGSEYGADIKSILHTPMASPMADDLISKCRMDIPIIGEAPAGLISVSAYDIDFDKKGILFSIAGQTISVEAA